MLAQLAGAEPLVQETFAEASDVLGYDLWKLCQGGPEEELGKTERTQPAMLAAGVATWRVWRKHGGGLPAAMAGHSLGEYSALVCSGALDFRTAVGLVQFRGQAMQAAVPAGQGAMAAILGLDDADVEAACREAAQGRRRTGRELQLSGPGRDRRHCRRGRSRDRSREERRARSARSSCR